MKTKDLYKELFLLVHSLDDSNLSGTGIGKHDVSDCKDSILYKIYHKDGYCFECEKIMEYKNEKSKVKTAYYEFYEESYSGFKTLGIEKAIKLIKKEGVFV